MPAFPGGRLDAGFAYDSVRNKVVMFGGNNGSAAINETWEFDPTTLLWQQITPVASPGIKAGPYMGYDPSRNKVVVFGGWTGSAFTNDTWEYDPATPTWTQKFPASPPTVAADAAGMSGGRLQYDPVRHTLVMCSGRSGTPSSNVDLIAVSEYNGTNWTNRAPTGGPPTVRESAGWIYDPARARFVLFGGQPWTQATLLAFDTWEYDSAANTWTQRTSIGGPVGLGMPLAFPWNGKIVAAFGVYNGLVLTPPQQWEWDGTAGLWTQNTGVVLPYQATGIRQPQCVVVPGLGALVFGGYTAWAGSAANAVNFLGTYDGKWNLPATTRRQTLSAPPATLPVVGNFSVAPGTQITANTPVGFDVTDNDDPLRRVIVVATMPDGNEEVVHDGSAFTPKYASRSVRMVIGTGYRFSLLPSVGRWSTAPTITVYAIDTAGNEA
jgi:hypothetical protein